jgi:hypothetical protein
MHSLTRTRRFFLMALALLFTLGFHTAQASNLDALLKNINKEIRTAQREMFAGKTEEAITRLGPIREMLQQAKQADPNNNRVKSCERKYSKLVGDLERRTGKSLGAGTTTARDSKAGPVADTAEAKEVMADVAGLMRVYQRVRPVLDKAKGTAILYYDLKPVEELLSQLSVFEDNDQALVEKALAGFSQKYGNTAPAIDAKAGSLGYHGDYSASYPYTHLRDGIANVAKTRVVMADDLVRRARKMMEQDHKRLHTFARLKNRAKIEAWTAAAARFDEDNPRVRAFQKELTGWLKNDLADLNAKAEEASWPPRAEGAPADAPQLASAIKTYLQKESDLAAAKGEEPRQIIAVSIAGPWRIHKKNLLAEPVQWGLPIQWAEVLQSEKAMDLARVYQGVMLTQVYKGVAKAPPYAGASVSGGFYIRPGKVK